MDNPEELALLGTALLTVQRLEFAIYGIAAHAAHLPVAAKEKRFRDLTPDLYLRGDIGLLKATLGQLVATFGDALLIRTSELDSYIADRNTIVHNYWRLTRAKFPHQQIESPIDFLRSFIERSAHMTAVINGLLARLMIAAAEKEGRQSELKLSAVQLRDLETYHRHAEQYVTSKGLA